MHGHGYMAPHSPCSLGPVQQQQFKQHMGQMEQQFKHQQFAWLQHQQREQQFQHEQQQLQPAF
jgi:hypothetical protein